MSLLTQLQEALFALKFTKATRLLPAVTLCHNKQSIVEVCWQVVDTCQNENIAKKVASWIRTSLFPQASDAAWGIVEALQATPA